MERDTLIATKPDWGVLLVAKLTDIYPMYDVFNQEYLAKVEESIRTSGLINPIVVMPLFVSDWKLLHRINPGILPPPEDKRDDEVVLQIRCGNNRYYAAKNLGYKFIDTKRVYTTDECNAVCKRMREECF